MQNKRKSKCAQLGFQVRAMRGATKIGKRERKSNEKSKKGGEHKEDKLQYARLGRLQRGVMDRDEKMQCAGMQVGSNQPRESKAGEIGERSLRRLGATKTVKGKVGQP